MQEEIRDGWPWGKRTGDMPSVHIILETQTMEGIRISSHNGSNCVKHHNPSVIIAGLG